MSQIAIAWPVARSSGLHWWVVPVAILRALALAVLCMCDTEPRWMVRR